MSKVVPLPNSFCLEARAKDLKAIGDNMDQAERLFSALRPDMSFAYREQIIKRANEFISVANDLRTKYYARLGKSIPDIPLLPFNYEELQNGASHSS